MAAALTPTPGSMIPLAQDWCKTGILVSYVFPGISTSLWLVIWLVNLSCYNFRKGQEVVYNYVYNYMLHVKDLEISTMW